MNRLIIISFLALAAVVLVLVQAGARRESSRVSTNLRDVVGQDLGAEESRWGGQYRVANAPRTFKFPEDHGPHDAFKVEWWYFTGNLAASAGLRFGYQLTFFRNALAPPGTLSVDSAASKWTTRQLYLAHFALTDVQGGLFHEGERVARGAAELAGATAEPFRVWVSGWNVESVGAATFPVRLQASNDDVEIDLTLDPRRPVVLQGEDGLSRKGDGPNQASYYYSITRLGTSGIVRIGGKSIPVEGLSWFDREWSTSLLGRTQVGWDWFSLQLDNGTDVMYFQLRESEPGVPGYSGGRIVSKEDVLYDLKDAQLASIDDWTTPDGVTYPSGWHLVSKERSMDLRIEPFIEDQELNLSIRYWEGAVSVSGVVDGSSVSGTGYVELTGYAR
ncbi:MAG: lipocalin-like domain-containing protein [Rhodothermales bacterium]